VICEKPFHPIGDAAFEQAMHCVRSVRRVMDAGFELGPCNRRMQDLIDEADRLGKLERG